MFGFHALLGGILAMRRDRTTKEAINLCEICYFEMSVIDLNYKIVICVYKIRLIF